MSTLTERQRAVLQFIADHTFNCNYPPTRREILDHLGVASLNTVEFYVGTLAEKGMLTVARGVSRGICLTKQGFAEIT